MTGIDIKYKNFLKVAEILKDRGGTRSGADRRKMFRSDYYPEKRSGKNRRAGRDRRKLMYLKYRIGLNLSGAFRDLT